MAAELRKKEIKMTQHEKYMQLALNLAKKAKGKCAPNPMVGAVVVNDGEIVGTGYHQKAGEPHAEVIAIGEAGKKAEGATIYVTLEPCSHHGKTPPCTDLIIKSNIKKVVFSIYDPNELVNSQKKLEESGIEVKTGILAEQAFALNETFFIRQILKRPLISLKLATSLDGFIADIHRKSQWITGFKSRKYTHQLRAEHRAIMAGTNTILADNPSLDVRHVNGENPLRVIIDRNGRIPNDANVFNTDNFVVFTSGQNHYTDCEYLEFDEFNLKKIFNILSEKYQICTVFVEGGSKLISSLLKENLFDYFYHFVASFPLGDGAKMFSHAFSLKDHPKFRREKILHLDADILIKYKKEPFSIKLENSRCLPA
jgi:diaminohydroxyphosphoribosylaminopyrimidine deaminase/5-amino-6-(5-phosphoribosylamino)uracil reductase